MNSCAIGVFFISLTLLFSLISSKRFSRCRNLRNEITSRGDGIENPKLIVEEYNLFRNYHQDRSDRCHGYDTCSECILQGTNSSCGWCALHNRCSLKKNCRGGECNNSRLWTTDVERCPKILSVEPPLLAAGTARMMRIDMVFPDYDGLFLCCFEVLGKTLLADGKKTKETKAGITCVSPYPYEIPETPVDHFTVKLSVRIPFGSNFASANFTIYDCSRYISCSECTASPFPCTWCVGGNRCTHDPGENCRNDILMTSKAFTGPSIRRGPGYCSRIAPNPKFGSNEIFVHSGSSRRIAVNVENFVQFQITSRITCHVESVGQVTGQLLADTVYCDSMTFKGLDRSPITNLSFSVSWDVGIHLDNIQNVHVVVYHCGLLASSCTECLELPEDFKCGWCGANNSCSLVEHCGESEWMDKKNKMCPKPKITSFHPKYGLPTQKTNITIKGVDFGNRIEDIERIRLLDIPRGVIMECTPWDYLFKGHSLYGIVCQLDVRENNEAVEGVFHVIMVDEFVAVSDEEYSFVDPNITGYAPVKGIESGGTHLKIEGHNLDAGNTVDVFIGNLPCKNVSRDSTTIYCITSPSPRTGRSEVRVIFDGEEKKLLSPDFFYVGDPYILYIKSEKRFDDAPVGTPSGGNSIFVEGERLDLMPNPYIYISIDGVEYPGSCTVKSNEHMECISPRLPADVLSFYGEERCVDYGFRMRAVKGVQNIRVNDEDFEKFRIYPDPIFVPFTEEGMTKIYKSDQLIINGKYLHSAFDEQDIKVHIGVEECVVTSLSQTQLVCKPPEAPPKEEDVDESNLPIVMVRVRERQEFFIGFLRYSGTQ